MTFQANYDVLPNGAYVYYSDTIPNSAGSGITARLGDLCLNMATVAGQPIGWMCTTAGSPGAWTVLGENQNYVTAGGANNAITATSSSLPLAVGMHLYVNLATFTLQAGANTLAYNGASAVAIKSHLNKASNIASAYSAGSIVPLMWDGTEWQDISQ